MKQTLFLLLLFTLALPRSFSQITARAVVDVKDQEQRSIPLLHIEPFLAYSAEWTADPTVSLFIRFYQSESGEWGQWLRFDPDDHSEREAPQYVSRLGFAPATSTRFEVRTEPRKAFSTLEQWRIHFFSPGKSLPAQPVAGGGNRLICPCPLPDYLDRLGWCPSGNCPPDPTPQPTDVTHLIVHHSAGSNTSSDWAAVVRSYWDLHVNVNGWDDIGYNWLIDPNGVLYEGRGNDLQGAHFCGYNVGTMGVCVMGTYSTVHPTGQAYQKLKELLAWKCCDRDIDPEDFSFHENSGLNLFHISGHRDGCATECPGDSLYNSLPLVRAQVRDYIDNTCDPSAVSGPEKRLPLLVFPNPASDVLYVQLPAEVPSGLVLRLIDPNGRTLWQSAGNYQGGQMIALSVKGFPKGWYSLHSGFPGGNQPVLIY